MTDNFDQPLRGRPPRQRKGIQPIGIVLTLIGLVLVGLVAWVILSWDPAATSAVTVPITEPAGSGEVVIRTPEQAAGEVGIFTPEGLPANDGVVIRELGGEAPVVLATAPVAGLLEPGPYGNLPRVGDNGLRPVEAYARPAADVGDVPRIAIIVGGLGLNDAGTNQAIDLLPGQVSLALAPYGTDLHGWAVRAREAGHEVFLQVPFEPLDFPAVDPGPHTLLVDAPVAENLDRLSWLMSQFTNYAGIVTYAGQRFTAEATALEPIVAEIERRGLMLVDDGAAPRTQTEAVATGIVPYARADLVIDVTTGASPTAALIATRLEQLEAIARERGFAIASASAFPASIQAISAWAAGLADRGIALVPITALANDPANGTIVRIP